MGRTIYLKMYTYILCYSNVKFEFFSFISFFYYSAGFVLQMSYIILINFETDLSNFLILLFIKLSYYIWSFIVPCFKEVFSSSFFQFVTMKFISYYI